MLLAKYTTGGNIVPEVVYFQWNNGADSDNRLTPRWENLLNVC